ncbi:hypothetical protein BABINDRAFT_104713 [Babjeviella inositovora NRRL Y-12698]|uniref:Uncharacterized protein n=1 Tax=Babjeviella inositovora NRRL Y-12698 TaxID=984486 RepID=A0A1E3QHB2_9ASCO|nr:uncharacterized protein BABINDRAFT_104713 [Babjeviella inositovora NRRL Y-12698]ODQ77086.1 hypothetical protein BABINDRAFT_104713 [Babjeviella inositovora NRRL Y-12698]
MEVITPYGYSARLAHSHWYSIDETPLKIARPTSCLKITISLLGVNFWLLTPQGGKVMYDTGLARWSSGVNSLLVSPLCTASRAVAQ